MWRSLALTVLIHLAVNESALAAVRLAAVQSTCSTIKLFEPCEITAEVEGRVINPYDPDEVRLQALFRPAQGDPISVQGFYYQPFELLSDGGREALRETGKPVWKVRFTPRQIGRWSYHVSLMTSQGTESSASQPFLVVNSSRKGFVRFDRKAGHFTFDVGEPFIPIGENLAWGPSFQPLRAYRGWFRELARQRANYIRVWLAPWSFRLETKETGIGRYDQARAWQLDYLLNQSEEAGLFWQLCLLNHGSFSRTQDPDWHNNPYNAQLGGMCRLPNDFLTDPRAHAMFQRLLRYMVSRWGYHPQLATWELFNEADYGEFRSEDLTAWLNHMSAFLQTLDVNQRPITTSFHKEAPPDVWRLPTIDVIQLHLYDQRDFAGLFGSALIPKLKQTFGKPVIIGEFGWVEDVMRKIDDVGIHLHDGLWSSVIGGASGGALIWYWDTYVHPNALQRHFSAAEMFWRDEQLSAHQQRLQVSLSDRDLAGWAIGDTERAYLWIKNERHTVDAYLSYRCELAKQRLRQSRGQLARPVAYSPRLVQGATATVRGLDWLGRYRIEWWDPYRGRIAERSVGRTRLGTLTVEVPSVRFDIAAKFIKLQWWERG